MKRLICILFSLLLLCGCTQSGRSFSLNSDSLNTSFQSEIGVNEFRGDISFDSEYNMLVTITYPDDIRGFSLYFTDNTFASSVSDVDNIHENNDLPDNFSFSVLYKLLKKAMTDGTFLKNAESAYEMTYDGVTLLADEQGNVTSARLKNASFIFKR